MMTAQQIITKDVCVVCREPRAPYMPLHTCAQCSSLLHMRCGTKTKADKILLCPSCIIPTLNDTTSAKVTVRKSLPTSNKGNTSTARSSTPTSSTAVKNRGTLRKPGEFISTTAALPKKVVAETSNTKLVPKSTVVSGSISNKINNDKSNNNNNNNNNNNKYLGTP